MDKTRIIPLYAPSDLHLKLDKYRKNSEGVEEYVASSLFIDIVGSIVCFESHSKFNGVSTGFPYLVEINVMPEKNITELLAAYPLLFEECLRNLLRLCASAIDRAQARVRAAQKSFNAIVTIAEKMREDDLEVQVGLASQQLRGYVGDKKQPELLRKIAMIAGNTPEERLERLAKCCKDEGYICSYFGLSSIEEAKQIILNTPVTNSTAQ